MTETTEQGPDLPVVPQSHASEDAPQGEEGISAPPVPADAVDLNVTGRQLAGPLLGFGQMWQKTYRVTLAGAAVTPQQVVESWKANFAEFWPEGSQFYGTNGGIQPGEVAVLNLGGPEGAPLVSTGIMVVYADDESFSFMTPQGHMFAGMITFSAESERGSTVAEVQALIRANDPLYELGCRVGLIHKAEDIFWASTLTNLARFFGVEGQPVTQQNILVDRRVQWGRAKNVWHNAAVRTTLYMAVRPARWVRGLLKRKRSA